MKIDAAFQDISALSIDTAPLIYFIEKNPIYLDKMRFIIQLVDSGQISGFSSVVTLTEVLTQPKKLGDKLIEKEYLDLLLHSRNFTIQNITIAIAEIAAEIRARYNIRTPDAFQIASAIESDCQAFLTNDRHLQQVNEIKVLILDNLEL